MRSDPSGTWFGIDDAITGPWDEIIVFAALAILSYCGVDWATKTQDELYDFILEN